MRSGVRGRVRPFPRPLAPQQIANPPPRVYPLQPCELEEARTAAGAEREHVGLRGKRDVASVEEEHVVASY